jgi:4-hydroxyphenylpyruvate dioxygenase
MNTTDAGETTLWCATVRDKSFEERIEAAQAGGFPAMSMFPIDYHTYTNAGLSTEEMHELMTESGVDVTVLDPFTKWLPKWEPPDDMSEEDLAFADFDENEFFEMGAALDVDSINLVEPFGNEISIDAAAESFGRVCDRAAKHDWRVHLEFMPVSGIPDLETAWAIVKQADRSNGGILFDSWHYFRGTPDHDLLRSIPGDQIFHVQLADAAAEVQGSLYNDLLHYRRLPGEGELDLLTVIGILDDIGGLDSVGVELFSDRFDELDPETAGKRSGESLQTVLGDVEASDNKHSSNEST